jgi:hypothetical protein
MNLFALTLGLAPAQPPDALPPAVPPAAAAPVALAPVVPAPAHPAYTGGAFPALTPAAGEAPSPVAEACAAPARRRFESDHAFDGFVNPISNPIFAKDPRSNTWARLLFVNNNFPGSHPFGGGNAQVYALQLNVALTERLAFIADKDGYADINPGRGAASNGWLNIAAGFKYTLVRDVENQFLFAAGLMYEVPSGDAAVFQNTGGGFLTPFVSWGKQFGDHWHVIGNHGFSFPLDTNEGSSFFYHSLHIDREIGGWFYPLVEFNWFQYTGGGDLLPRAVGEGDGLLNLGTRDMNGRQLFSTAFGAKVKFCEHLYAGGAYEVALSDYKGLLNNRVIVDLVLRY